MFKYVLFTAAGFAMGYYVAQTRLEEDYAARLDEATMEAKYHYRDFYKKKAGKDGATKAAEAMDDYAGVTVGPDILTQEASATVKRAVDRGDLTGSVTDDAELLNKVVSSGSLEDATQVLEVTPPRHPGKLSTTTWDAGSPLTIGAGATPKVNYNRISTPEKPAEEAKAESTAPATPEQSDEMQVDRITKKAFIENQFGYEQFSFTYFGGDDVLANEEDEKVTGKARYLGIGLEALDTLKAGLPAMEGEPVIYVRNHTERCEFEVTRSEGKYSDEVQK